MPCALGRGFEGGGVCLFVRIYEFMGLLSLFVFRGLDLTCLGLASLRYLLPEVCIFLAAGGERGG